MIKVEYTPQARADIETIIDYSLAQWGASQTMAYVDGLELLTRRLSEQPKLGKSRFEFRAGMRSLVYQSHVIYYLNSSNSIVILRVLHGRQLPDDQFA